MNSILDWSDNLNISFMNNSMFLRTDNLFSDSF